MYFALLKKQIKQRQSHKKNLVNFSDQKNKLYI